MRKIEKDMLKAIRERRNWRCKNTAVEVSDETVNVYLHGNRIAALWRESGKLYMTLAGWPTVTTRSRLNAITEGLLGERCFYQMDHMQCYDGPHYIPDEGRNYHIAMDDINPRDIVEVQT